MHRILLLLFVQVWIKENIDQYSGTMCFASWTRNLEFIVTGKMFSNKIYRYNCGLRDYVWNYKQQTCLFETWQTQEYHNTMHKKLHQNMFNFWERIQWRIYGASQAPSARADKIVLCVVVFTELLKFCQAMPRIRETE